MLSSPDRDDDLLQERLRALHDAWPGDPADDDPLRLVRTGGADSSAPPARRLLGAGVRALLRRLGAAASGLPLAPRRSRDPS